MSEKKNLLRVRAALYIRVSTQEQAMHGLSMDDQRAMLENWAKKERVKVIGVYMDGGISARKKATKRPGLQRMLDDIKNDKIDLVVFTRLDRWFRSIAEYYKVQEILEAHHVDWKTILEDYDTSTASGRLKVNIMLSVAQDEADRTSERIKATMKAAKERGESLAGSVPLGYKRVNRHIVIDPETAPVVRKAFEMYMDTGSISRVVRTFSALRLDYQIFSNMLKNKTYTGDFHGVSVEPLLTPEEQRSIENTRHKRTRKTKERRTYIFSGLLICAACGRRMSGKSVKRKYDDHMYYICSGRVAMACEAAKIISEKNAEIAMMENISEVIETAVMLEQESGVVSHKAERDAIKRKLSRLADLYVDELISIDDYKRQHNELQAALDAIPEDIPAKDITAAKQAFSGDWQSTYSQLSRDKKQEFWRKFVDKVIIKDGKVQDIFLR